MELLVITALLVLLVAFLWIALRYAFEGAQTLVLGKGKVVEMWVHNDLATLHSEYSVISNALFENGSQSVQIDHIVISPYGIFVIETKGYKGRITGGEDSEQWTQSLYGGYFYNNRKYRFYNPIRQNAGHVRFLEYLLRNEGIVLPIIPIVVFEDDAELLVNVRNHIVVRRYFLIEAIRKYRDPVISEETKARIQSVIESNIRTGKEAEDRHIQNVREKNAQIHEKVSKGICPRCGGNLVLRKGRYGEFWGCSNYPRCRFTYQG